VPVTPSEDRLLDDLSQESLSLHREISLLLICSFSPLVPPYPAQQRDHLQSARPSRLSTTSAPLPNLPLLPYSQGAEEPVLDPLTAAAHYSSLLYPVPGTHPAGV
jgi:hypothetical protein